MSNAMLCPGCQKFLSEESQFCPDCGQEINPATEGETETLERSELVSVANDPASNLPALDPDAIRALLTQANLCRIRKQWSEAIDHCVAILQQQPGNQAAHALLGDIYRDQGKVDDAIQWYRMAVDLEPNPADIAKLEKLERERAALVRVEREGGRLPVALSADGSHVAGTGRLMGVSPRRWLGWMTLVSLTFLSVMVVALIVTQMRKGTRPAALPRSGMQVASNNLPAPSPLVSLSNPGSNAPRPQESVGGAGMPADARSAQTPSGNAANAENGATERRPLPPAPVLKVKPMTGIPPFDPNRSNEPEPDTPDKTPEQATPAANPAPALPRLPGEMQVTQMQGDPATGVTLMRISAPPTILNRSDLHDFLLRTIYRAARHAFTAEPAAKTAQISIQSGATGLLTAEIERQTSAQTDPDATPPLTLQDRLSSLNWGRAF